MTPEEGRQKKLHATLLGLFVLQCSICNFGLWTAKDAPEKTLRLFHVETFAAAPQAADWINAQTPEGSRLWIWGSEAEIYFLSRRLPATRFLFNYPFSGEAPPWPGGDQQLKLTGSLDPQTQAVLLSESLPRGELAQFPAGQLFAAHGHVAPPFMIGLRKH